MSVSLLVYLKMKCPNFTQFSVHVKPSHGGMQSSIFLCLSEARINWEGCGRKVSKWGIDGDGWLIDLGAMVPTRIVSVSASCYPL